MKNYALLFTGVTLIGGSIISLLAGSWMMLAAAIILMGGASVIGYLGLRLTFSGAEEIPSAAQSSDKRTYHRVCAGR